MPQAPPRLAAPVCALAVLLLYMAVYSLGRVHVYSPFWLVFAPTGLGTAPLNIVGSIPGLAFIFSLFLLPTARSWRDAIITTIAILLPAVFWAVEGGNNNLVVFVLTVLVVRAVIAGGAWPNFGYMLIVLAGLLKVYRATLAILAIRAPLRSRLIDLQAAESAFLLSGGTMFVGCFWTETSNGYRAIVLLLLLPALLRLGRNSRSMTAAAWGTALLPRGWVLPIQHSGAPFGTLA
jgi:hypothetical protein